MSRIFRRVSSNPMVRERKRDLTPEQAKELAKFVRAEIYPYVSHGSIGLGEILGIDQSTASLLVREDIEPTGSYGLAMRVSKLLGLPLERIVGLPAAMPSHKDSKIQLAMRAAVLSGVPQEKVDRALAADPKFDVGDKVGADDYFRRFAEGYVRTAKTTADTDSVRTAIAHKKKRR